MRVRREYVPAMIMALALLLFALPGGVCAQDPPPGDIDPPVGEVDPFVTPERLDELREEGMSWGEIKHGVALAEKLSADSETPLSGNEALDRVLQMREEGMGWGNISKELGYKLGPTISGKSAKEIKNRMRIDPDIESPEVERMKKSPRPEGASRPEKAPKPEKIQKPEKPPKPERIQKPEKPEKPPKPEKIQKPEKPEKPPKPEKPERVSR